VWAVDSKSSGALQKHFSPLLKRGKGFLVILIIGENIIVKVMGICYPPPATNRKPSTIMIFALNSQNPQVRFIKKIVEALRNGGIIIYPTDTVYGIGCDLFNKKSIEKIYQIARRSTEQPLSFICPDLKDISTYANVSDFAYRVLKRHLPGPYTFILEATRLVPKIIMPKRRTVGIRVPNDNICLSILKEFGHPIISATVKDEMGEPLSDPREIYKRFGHTVDIVADGGNIAPDESTVISLIDDQFLIIRQGKGDIHTFCKQANKYEDVVRGTYQYKNS